MATEDAPKAFPVPQADTAGHLFQKVPCSDLVTMTAAYDVLNNSSHLMLTCDGRTMR